MRPIEKAGRRQGRIRLIVTKGFILPCAAYLMIGLALYPQLGVLASMVGLAMSGRPSAVEWIFASIYFMIIGIFGVVAHELGHALVIKHRHRSTALVVLSSQVGTRHSALKDSSRLMALCGPALQAAYGITVLSICMPFHLFYFGVLGCYIILDAVYNLLPFRNYDGYHVFRRKAALPVTGQSGSPAIETA